MADEHEQKLEPPLQQMNRTIAMLEHEKAILKQEVTQMYEEILKYRSALHGYEGTHTRIEHLEQQLAQARELLMLARGLIINDSKPAAVSMWVSKHDAILAQQKEASNGK